MTRNDLRWLWWLRPSKLLILFVLPIYIISNWAMKNNKITYAYKDVRIYYDNDLFIFGLLFILLFALISFLFENIKISYIKEDYVFYVPRLYLNLFMVISLCSYFAFSFNIITNPGLVIGFFKGNVSPYAMKNMANIHSGLTTFTQISPLVVYAYLMSSRVNNRIGRSKFLKFGVVILIFFTFLRGMLFSERLAIIEMGIAVFIYYLQFLYKPSNLKNKLISFMPFMGILFLYILFISAEYNRSWASYYINIFDNIWEFGLIRLSMYYLTSVNNGYMLIHQAGFFGGDYTYILSWFYKLPIVGPMFHDYIGVNFNPSQIISTYSSLEFNNPSGIFIYFLDVGYGAYLISVLFGVIFGVAYKAFNNGSRASFIYPIYFVAILETLRVPYVFEGRNVPIVIVCIVFYFVSIRRFYYGK